MMKALLFGTLAAIVIAGLTHATDTADPTSWFVNDDLRTYYPNIAL